jgi:hypothetical protein
MEVFVLKSLEKLRADSSRRDTEFREAADLVIRACTARDREGGMRERARSSRV